MTPSPSRCTILEGPLLDDTDVANLAFVILPSAILIDPEVVKLPLLSVWTYPTEFKLDRRNPENMGEAEESNEMVESEILMPGPGVKWDAKADADVIILRKLAALVKEWVPIFKSFVNTLLHR